MKPRSNSADKGAGSGCMARLVRCFFILPARFVRDFFCVYWEIATAPEWNRGDRLMARYFWPIGVIIIVILSSTTPQCVKLEKETRPQQEQTQPQAVSPEKGKARLRTSEDDLVGIDVTTCSLFFIIRCHPPSSGEFGMQSAIKLCQRNPIAELKIRLLPHLSHRSLHL